MAEVAEPLRLKLIPSERKDDEITIAVSILEKQYKSEEDLLFLRTLLKQVGYVDKLLANLEYEAQLDLLGQIKLKTYEKEDVVFYKDDMAREFFMLLQGSVYVITRVEQSDPHIKIGMYSNRAPRHSKTMASIRFGSNPGSESQLGSPSKRTTISPKRLTLSPTRKPLLADISPRKTLNISPIRMTMTPQTMSDAFGGSDSFSEFLERASSSPRKAKNEPIMSEGTLLNSFPNHKLLNTLYAPNYFGEIALNESTTRTATVVCREACIIATLHKSVYQRVLAQHYERQNKEKMDFLKTIPMLSTWPLHSISALFRNSGEPVAHVYFIKSGEVELSKKIILENHFDDFLMLASPNLKADFEVMQKFKMLNVIWKNKINRKERLKIGIVSVGEVLGDVDFVDKNMLREYTAVCYSPEVELYAVDLNVFLANARQFPEIVHALEQSKKKWRDQFQKKIIECYESKWTMYNDRLVRGIKFQEIHAQKLKESFQAVTKNPLMIKETKIANAGNKNSIGFKSARESAVTNLATKGTEIRETILSTSRLRSKSNASSFQALNSPREPAQKQSYKIKKEEEKLITPRLNSKLEYVDFNFFATKRTSEPEPRVSFVIDAINEKKETIPTQPQRRSVSVDKLESPQNEQSDTKKKPINFGATISNWRNLRLRKNASQPLLHTDFRLIDFMDKPQNKTDRKIADSKKSSGEKMRIPIKPSSSCTSLADIMEQSHSTPKKVIKLPLHEHLFIRSSFHSSNASTMRDSVVSTHRSDTEKEIRGSSTRNPLQAVFYASNSGMKPSRIARLKKS